jgi:hypothetical protein
MGAISHEIRIVRGGVVFNVSIAPDPRHPGRVVLRVTDFSGDARVSIDLADLKRLIASLED